jgi:hypothetical protein
VKLYNIAEKDGATDAIFCTTKFILPVEIINIQNAVATKA